MISTAHTSLGRLGVIAKTFQVVCHCGIGQRIETARREDAVIALREFGWEQHHGDWQCPACLAEFAANRLNSK